MKHRPSRIGRLLAALLAVALVASCEDPSSPELVEAWTLETWFGQEPPVLMVETEDPDEPGVMCQLVLVSAEIELRTQRHFDMIDALTRTCGDDEPRAFTERREGTWTLEGDSLFLDIETDDPILPTAPLNGRIVDDRLRFEYEVFSEGEGVDTVAIVYRRTLD